MKCPWCGKEVPLDEYSDHLEVCPKYEYKERPGYERGGIIPPSEIVYHRIRQEEFASEFLDNCIQKTRELYGLTEDMVKQLIKDMGYNPSGNGRKEKTPGNPTTVYAASYGKCPVKITKRGAKWNVYNLKEVIETRKTFKEWDRPTEIVYTFVWETRPFESLNYQPYEEKDVFSSPQPLVKHVKTWCPSKIRKR